MTETITNPGTYSMWLRGRKSDQGLYEEHRALELAFKGSKRDLLTALVADVVGELGEGWQVAPWPVEHGYGREDGSTRLHRPADDAWLYVGWDGWDKFERVTVAVRYPDGTRDAYHGAEYPTASVRADRGAKALASAIRTRVLPQYLEHLAKAQQAIEERAGRAGRVATLAATFAGMVPGGHVRQDDGAPRAEVSWFRNEGPYGNVTVSADSARLELNNLTHEQVIRILDSLT